MGRKPPRFIAFRPPDAPGGALAVVAAIMTIVPTAVETYRPGFIIALIVLAAWLYRSIHKRESRADARNEATDRYRDKEVEHRIVAVTGKCDSLKWKVTSLADELQIEEGNALGIQRHALEPQLEIDDHEERIKEAEAAEVEPTRLTAPIPPDPIVLECRAEAKRQYNKTIHAELRELAHSLKPFGIDGATLIQELPAEPTPEEFYAIAESLSNVAARVSGEASPSETAVNPTSSPSEGSI